VLDRDRARADPLEVVGEAAQHPALDLELVAERSAQLQVVLGGTAERVHAAVPASGHGRASVRNVARSTFA
jgi:hypothetical protein